MVSGDYHWFIGFKGFMRFIGFKRCKGFWFVTH